VVFAGRRQSILNGRQRRLSLAVSEDNCKSKDDEGKKEGNRDFHSDVSLSAGGAWRNLTDGDALENFRSRTLPHGSGSFPLKRSTHPVRKVQIRPLFATKPQGGVPEVVGEHEPPVLHFVGNGILRRPGEKGNDGQFRVCGVRKSGIMPSVTGLIVSRCC
jgi:hypothetical protein